MTEKKEYIPGIHCEVTNCAYNDQKYNCYAQEIEVGKMQAEAKKEDDTKCSTFHQKTSGTQM